MIDLEKVINGKASNAKGFLLLRKKSNYFSRERCITAEINQRGFGICIANIPYTIYSNHITFSGVGKSKAIHSLLHQETLILQQSQG
jgi:hypothetical protein